MARTYAPLPMKVPAVSVAGSSIDAGTTPKDGPETSAGKSVDGLSKVTTTVSPTAFSPTEAGSLDCPAR